MVRTIEAIGNIRNDEHRGAGRLLFLRRCVGKPQHVPAGVDVMLLIPTIFVNLLPWSHCFKTGCFVFDHSDRVGNGSLQKRFGGFS